jgi:hypothetical protein
MLDIIDVGMERSSIRYSQALLYFHWLANSSHQSSADNSRHDSTNIVRLSIGSMLNSVIQCGGNGRMFNRDALFINLLKTNA